MRPHIYSVCDQGYFDTYGVAFLNSASAQGHSVELFCDHKKAETDEDKARYLAWRYKLLPGLLEKHSAVLLVDVDSVITRPIEIEDKYDLGIFLRLHKKELHMRTLGTVFYCTDRAKKFAKAMAASMRDHDVRWYYDQVILLALYNGMGYRYRIKTLDRSFVSWKPEDDAPIFTGKGFRKDRNGEFARLVNEWKGRNADLQVVS
jgi:hypothetical protein